MQSGAARTNLHPWNLQPTGPDAPLSASLPYPPKRSVQGGYTVVCTFLRTWNGAAMLRRVQGGYTVVVHVSTHLERSSYAQTPSVIYATPISNFGQTRPAAGDVGPTGMRCGSRLGGRVSHCIQIYFSEGTIPNCGGGVGMGPRMAGPYRAGELRQQRRG